MEENHIIHKVVVEVSVNNREKAHAIKDDISSFLTMDIFPKLEKHFRAVQASLPAHTVQISRLTLDLSHSESSLNTTLKNNIIESFRKELSEIIKTGSGPGNSTPESSGIKLLGEEERLLYTFIYFLEKGVVPWWHSSEKPVAIFEPGVFEKIIATKAFTTEVLRSIQKPVVRERIINQFTDAQIVQILQAVIKTRALKIAPEHPVIQRLATRSFADRKVIWSLFLNLLAESSGISGDTFQQYTEQEVIATIPLLEPFKDKQEQEQLWKALKTVFPFITSRGTFSTISTKNRETANPVVAKAAEKDTNRPGQELQKTDPRQKAVLPLKKAPSADQTEAATGYQVTNAGLVLIHPFIGHLFKYCNLMDPETKTLTDPETAIHLLHYIATGKTNQPESDMLFEKFLCDVPLHQSINRHVKLSRKHKGEAAKVIDAVRQNWSPMKTASTGLLQNEFFQRPGKLALDNQTLTVERKTQDILLDKLSWGIGMIKLPWQSQFIFVNW